MSKACSDSRFEAVKCMHQVLGFALVQLSAVAIFLVGEYSAEQGTRFRSRIKSRVMN